MFLEKNKILSGALFFLISIEIFWFSSLPGVGIGNGGSWPSRIYHFTIFFLFAFFLFNLIKTKNTIKQKEIYLTLIIAIIYAFTDEFHQLFINGRSASIKDVLTDTIGIFSAIIIHLKVYLKEKIKRDA